MLRLTTDKKIDIMDAKNAPSARCKSGDTVLFETLDCYDCSVTRQGERLKIDRMHNPATGPLFVEGAEVGDALKVEIIKITTRDWGAMGTSFGEFGFKNVQGSDHSMHVYDIKDGVVRAGGFDIPVDNMIGVIGVAPAGEGVLTVTPGAHGGNMDCRRIREGATIYFPVAAEGALLSMGDLHALMGDGEVFGYGLEVSGEVTVRVTAVKGMKLEQPLLIEGGDAMTVASGETMQEATEKALESMYHLLRQCGQDEGEAGILMSMVCNIALCQMVNPLFTVRAEMPVHMLEKAIKG